MVLDSSSRIVYFARSHNQEFYTIGKEDGFEVIMNSSTLTRAESCSTDISDKKSLSCDNDSNYLSRMCKLALAKILNWIVISLLKHRFYVPMNLK